MVKWYELMFLNDGIMISSVVTSLLDPWGGNIFKIVDMYQNPKIPKGRRRTKERLRYKWKPKKRNSRSEMEDSNLGSTYIL